MTHSNPPRTDSTHALSLANATEGPETQGGPESEETHIPPLSAADGLQVETVELAPKPAGGAMLGVITIVLTLVGWTSIPLFLKYFSNDIDYYNANGWRYGFSALLWAPAIVWAYAMGKFPKGLWKAALLPALFNTIAQHCFGVAPYKMDPGLMTFSLRSQVIFVTIGAAIMFIPERKVIATKGYLIGLAMVLIGTLLTLYLKPGGLGEATKEGIALSVLAGASYAGYALCVRKVMHGINPLIAFAVVSQYTALVLVSLMVMFGAGHGMQALELMAPLPDSTALWGFLTYPGSRFALLLLSAVIGIGLGHTFYFIAIQRLGLAVANSVVQLQPITVSICSMLIFGEILTSGQWFFGIVAVTGAGIILYAQRMASKKDAARFVMPAKRAATTKGAS